MTKSKRKKKPADMEPWDELDGEIQEALLAWFNCTVVSDQDKLRLAKLVSEERFWHWDCILCGQECNHAEPTEEEWPHFQGCSDDLDWTYFGNSEVYTRAALTAMCNHCRGFKCCELPEGAPEVDE